MPQRPLHVAVGILEDDRGRILVTQRPTHVHQGGLWEFPGGKVEPGESLFRALARELKEELGITLVEVEPLIRIHHSYSDVDVLLDVHRVLRWTGRLVPGEGQPLMWLHQESLKGLQLPAADRPILTALRLPRQYLITGDDPSRPREFLERLERSLARGIKLVQFRAKSLSKLVYQSLAREVIACVHGFGARVLLNAAPIQAIELGADGVHLPSAELQRYLTRPLDEEYLLGASCHGRAELDQAMSLGADFAVLSPVKTSLSHPDIHPLGWESFANLIEPVPLPVYALGGMEADDLNVALTCGAQGIAGISAFWSRDH